MALEDFLGKNSEIKIIDFLSGNCDFAYNQTEISECTGICRTTVNQKIPHLLYNGLLEISHREKNINYYKLADNKIVRALIGAVFANSFFVADYETEETEAIEMFRKEVGSVVYEKNRFFCYQQNDLYRENTGYQDKFERWASGQKEWQPHVSGILIINDSPKDPTTDDLMTQSASA